MKLSNYILIFFGIVACFFLIVFTNIDINSKVNIQNIEYTNKLTSACYDAAQSMNGSNIETYGCVWHNNEDLEKTLKVFYESLSYSFNQDTASREEELTLYTPVVVLVDVDGYYISHNVVFDDTGMVQIDSLNAKNRKALTGLNTWTETFGTGGLMLRYFLNNEVEVYATDGTVFRGNRNNVYKMIQERRPGSEEEAYLSFIANSNKFNQKKNSIIVREINNQVEYYINRHNFIGVNNYEMQYAFEMPEVKGEDWNRMLTNPTVISFFQGYSSKADNKFLNVYALAAGELIENYHYFIYNGEYHCVEACPDVSTQIVEDRVPYIENGATKERIIVYTKYIYQGTYEVETVYYNQTDCAKRGATPHKCITEWK